MVLIRFLLIFYLLILCRADVYSNVPYTTRAPREGEVDGEKYRFVSKETFQTMIDRDEFIEYGKFDGHLYGTAKRRPFRETIAEGENVPNDAGKDIRPSNTNKDLLRRSRAYAASVKSTSRPKTLVIKHNGPFQALGLELVEASDGVFVLDVEEGSPAAKAGIRKSMQIMAVDGADLKENGLTVARQRLGKLADEHEVVVRYNSKAFSLAATVNPSFPYSVLIAWFFVFCFCSDFLVI